MNQPTNEVRAAWAREAVAGLDATTNFNPGDELDMGATIGDLLANLMHLCRQEKHDFNSLLAMGRMHFEAETGEEA